MNVINYNLLAPMSQATRRHRERDPRDFLGFSIFRRVVHSVIFPEPERSSESTPISVHGTHDKESPRHRRGEITLRRLAMHGRRAAARRRESNRFLDPLRPWRLRRR